jgi:tRNA dimethylallyltransferase
LDYLEATEASTTKRFLEEVEGLLIEALKSSRPVILVGGSGFYERALVEGISPGEPSDPVFQKSLEEFSNEELHARLLRNDVRWGEKIFPNDRYRVTRYLDLVERQALSWSTLKGPKLRNRELAKIWKQTSTLVLKADVDRKLFKAPLAARIDQMFDEGWIEEVQCLLKNFPPECPGLQSIGYRELCAGLANPQSDDFDAIKSDILHSHLHYVKKQQTWLRPLLRCG